VEATDSIVGADGTTRTSGLVFLAVTTQAPTRAVTSGPAASTDRHGACRDCDGRRLGTVPRVPDIPPPHDRQDPRDPHHAPDLTGPPSVPLRTVVGVVVLEAVLLLALALFLLGEAVLAEAANAGAGVVTAVVAVLFGGFLAVCARALWRRQRWARGPVVCWQLLQLLTAATTSFSEQWWIPGLLVVASLVAGVGLLLPRVIAETTGSADPPVL